MKGDICPGNIENKDGKLIIEKGRLVTSRHIRLLKDSNVDSISADVASIEGYITSKPVIDPNTGEIFVDANVVLTREIIDNITELEELKEFLFYILMILIAVHTLRIH